MPNCQKLQTKFENMSEQVKRLPELLAEYKKNPTDETKKRIRSGLEQLHKFEDSLVEAIESFFSEHPHAQEFEGKLSFENGKVVITNGLGFSHKDGVHLPSIIDKIEGYLALRNLESPEHLELPERIEGPLYLDSLESAGRLELPSTIEGGLILTSLESAEHLKLPNKIEGPLFLSGLESAEHLELHGNITGNIYLDSLSQKERKQLQDEYPNLADQITAF